MTSSGGQLYETIRKLGMNGYTHYMCGTEVIVS